MADVVEAMIGAFYSKGGLLAACYILNKLNIIKCHYLLEKLNSEFSPNFKNDNLKQGDLVLDDAWMDLPIIKKCSHIEIEEEIELSPEDTKKLNCKLN